MNENEKLNEQNENGTLNPQDSLMKRHKKFFQLLAGVQLIGILLAVISVLFVPFASYNPTVLDSTKVSLKLFDLAEEKSFPVFGLFLSCTPLVLDMFLVKQYNQPNWKENSKLYLRLAIVCFICFIIGYIMITWSIDDYYSVNGREFALESEAGNWMFLIGGVLFAAMPLIETILVKLVVEGKYTEDQLLGKF